MRGFILLTSLAVLPLTATHAAPADVAAVSNARASASSSEEVIETATAEKVICRRDKEIGSRVKARRVCMTAKQWAEKASEERTYLEQRQAQRTLSE